MIDKVKKLPGPDHPITVEPNPGRVVIRFDGKVIADSNAALTLREASYPPVHYIPRDHVDMSLLQRSEQRSYCPYKGEASYYSLATGGARSQDAVWSYEDPYDAVVAIKGHFAFYPDRVQSIEDIPQGR